MVNYISLKSVAMMRSDPNPKLVDKYRSILESKINNIAIVNLAKGYKVLELDLGE